MASTELATAYVNIIPSAKGIKGSISNILTPEADNAGKVAGEKAGSNFTSKLKTLIAAAGIGTLIKETFEAGANLQQSFGGLETLYGDAADAAKNMPQKLQLQEFLQTHMQNKRLLLEHH